MDLPEAEDPLAPRALVEAAARAAADAEALERLERHVPQARSLSERLPPREFWRMVYRASGRSEGFRQALTLGAWPLGIQRRIHAEELGIRESGEPGPMAPGAGPRLHRDGFIAGLRDAMAIVEAMASGSHPLDAESDPWRGTLPVRQIEHLGLLRRASKNWLDGDVVADDLLHRTHLWRLAVLGGRRDTLYVVPAQGADRLLECLAQAWQPDECSWVWAEYEEAVWAEAIRYQAEAGGGGVRVLRVWWD